MRYGHRPKLMSASPTTRKKLKVKVSYHSLAIRYPYDLRCGIEEKHFDSGVGWTAFVNNAGTLCHVLHPEESWLIRLPLKPSVKYSSVGYIRQRVKQMLHGRLVM